MKRFGIAAGAAAALLVCLGAYGVNKFTADQANTAAPGSINLSGVSAAVGSSFSFARADHVHSTSGTLPEARGGTNAGALTCNADQSITSNGTSYSCSANNIQHDATLTGAGSTASNLGIALSNANTWSGAQTLAPSSGITTATSSGATRGQIVFTPMAADPTTPAGDGEAWVSGAAGAARHASVRLNGANALFAGNPMLSAYLNTTENVLTATSTNICSVASSSCTVDTDTDSGFSTSTGVYTVPAGKGGHYFISCGVAYTAAITATDVEIDIFINGSHKHFAQTVNPAAVQSIIVSAVIAVPASQTIECKTSQNSGATKVMAAASAYTTFVNLKRVSD